MTITYITSYIRSFDYRRYFIHCNVASFGGFGVRRRIKNNLINNAQRRTISRQNHPQREGRR